LSKTESGLTDPSLPEEAIPLDLCKYARDPFAIHGGFLPAHDRHFSDV